jgi:hypothetical protein
METVRGGIKTEGKTVWAGFESLFALKARFPATRASRLPAEVVTVPLEVSVLECWAGLIHSILSHKRDN